MTKNKVDPTKATHTFQTASATGHNLTVPREAAELVYAHTAGPVLGVDYRPNLYCSNCGGAGILHFFFCRDASQFMPHAKFKSYNNLFWEYDHRSWNCPVCRPESKQWAVSALLETSGVDEKYWNYNPAYFRNVAEKRDAVNAALDILAGVPRPVGLLAIFGAHGVGKTGLAYGVVSKACKAGVEARYLLASDFIKHIQATMRRDSAYSAQEVYAEWMKIQLLVIDEIKTGDESAWQINEFRAFLNRRYELRESRATILITNAEPGALGDGWAYLEDRLKDGKRVVMGGESMRGKQLEISTGAAFRLPYADSE